MHASCIEGLRSSGLVAGLLGHDDSDSYLDA